MAVKENTEGKSSKPRNRRALAREARIKRQRQQRMIYAAGAVIIVALLGFFAVRTITAAPVGEAVPSLGNLHVEESQVGQVVYNSTPPTSGPHLGQLARWGIHTEPVPNELQVHNLEDGGVMVQYNCPEGCEELVAQLTTVVNRYGDRHLILAPYPDMDTRIALTAWGRIDKLDAFDEARIERFIDKYEGIDNHAG